MAETPDETLPSNADMARKLRSIEEKKIPTEAELREFLDQLGAKAKELKMSVEDYKERLRSMLNHPSIMESLSGGTLPSAHVSEGVDADVINLDAYRARKKGPER